jgi:catechol 2,3-dioxygenase-like lactoylglutathione lyase family enzyme
MFSHVVVSVGDLVRARQFYGALLAPLGFEPCPAVSGADGQGLCWCLPGQILPRFFIREFAALGMAGPGLQTLIAFHAPSPMAVREAFRAGLAQGGVAEDEPKPMPQLGEGYFGASLSDPDGNRLHLAYRGDVRR